MTEHPPKLAAWLLYRFGPREDFLAGDLAEQFNRGKSRCWYWRQALGAILVNILEELRAGKAVLLNGWLTWLCLEVAWNLMNLIGAGGQDVAWLPFVFLLRWGSRRTRYLKRELYAFLVLKFVYVGLVLRTMDFYRPRAKDLAFGLSVLTIAPVVFFLVKQCRRNETHS